MTEDQTKHCGAAHILVAGAGVVKVGLDYYSGVSIWAAGRSYVEHFISQVHHHLVLSPSRVYY
jgi:hypothetical protein